MSRNLVAFAAAATLASLVACSNSPTTQGSSKDTQAATPARPVGGHGHAAFMGSYDANRDGTATRDEYDTLRKQRFIKADTDGNGSLNEAEYIAEFEGRLKQQYAAEKKAPDESYQNSMRQAHVRFGILDTNKDGTISVEEELAIAERTFKGADHNGDGKVDAADEKASAKP